MLTLLNILLGLVLLVGLGTYFQLRKMQRQQQARDSLDENLGRLLQQTQLQLQQSLLSEINQTRQEQQQSHHQFQQQFSQQLHQEHQNLQNHSLERFRHIQDMLLGNARENREQLTNTLQVQTQRLSERFDKLTTQTEQHLVGINQRVESRLSEGFEKTNATFTDIIKRLALIDQAQQKITELSSNVVSLQSILDDKRSRGVFGEIQLAHLIENTLPDNRFSLQYTLSNGRRCDCILFLPEPGGNLVIDAKFPLETFRQIAELSNDDPSRKSLAQQFRRDIKKHIQDIAERYIIPGETADGAMMFVPAEAIFAEIHANYPDLVSQAQQSRIWLVSPTTLMAVLTTARSVIKDAATREQIHLIQAHLSVLSKDFQRFKTRMNNLTNHIQRAQKDVEEVNISANKISQRFSQIEAVELQERQPDSKPTTAITDSLL